ncbi:MAG: aminopeptidase [Gammaproteobacteria bacterium]|nr:aminopeptidase [Gammaproteobacteria bacterium]
MVILLCSIVLPACSSINYYLQTISGQMEVLHKRQDINEIISQSESNENIIEKLILIEDILTFAHQELLLPDNGSYRQYTDLKRPYVVWNVIAAPVYSLEAKKWCYLFLGCLSYRGFFNEAAAIEYAESLQQDNYEVYIGGVAAYSTLGWFKDPVINTMLNREDWEIARLIFHELAHQVIYIDDDTDYNEAFADAVSRIGLNKWLQKQPAVERQRIQQILDREDLFINTILSYRNKLVALYASSNDKAEIINQKNRIITSLRNTLGQMIQDWDSKPKYQSWLNNDINNARLAIVATYRSLLPGFIDLYQAVDKDLGNFYARIKELSECQRDQRRLYLGIPNKVNTVCGDVEN